MLYDCGNNNVQGGFAILDTPFSVNKLHLNIGIFVGTTTHFLLANKTIFWLFNFR